MKLYLVVLFVGIVSFPSRPSLGRTVLVEPITVPTDSLTFEVQGQIERKERGYVFAPYQDMTTQENSIEVVLPLQTSAKVTARLRSGAYHFFDRRDFLEGLSARATLRIPPGQYYLVPIDAAVKLGSEIKVAITRSDRVIFLKVRPLGIVGSKLAVRGFSLQPQDLIIVSGHNLIADQSVKPEVRHVDR